jgi:two-component system, chemotaxis family, protein-glutamate methylesterase/glutaminase
VNAPLRVLVVDDSPVNRHLITEAVDRHEGVRVVGHAGNGEQALRMVAELEPDAITLDVEMPKMDGFTFLRILMSSRPTAVVVLSSYSAQENILKALELGATDFMAKPEDLLTENGWGKSLVEKLLATRAWRRPPRLEFPSAARESDRKRPDQTSPRFVAGLAASTGGPGALLTVLSKLPSNFPGALMIAQHMAPGFTKSFAERLNRTTPLCVREAVDGEPVFAGHAYVCPGGMCMELRREAQGSLRVSVDPPRESDRYVPSGTRLFKSLARVVGPRALGVVLTGMADDGVDGARAIRENLGEVIVESEETAVVFGMPGAVLRAGLATHVVPLGDIAHWMRQFRRLSTDGR